MELRTDTKLARYWSIVNRQTNTLGFPILEIELSIFKPSLHNTYSGMICISLVATRHMRQIIRLSRDVSHLTLEHRMEIHDLAEMSWGDISI